MVQPDAGRASSRLKDRLGRTSRCLTRLAAVHVDLWLGARQAADWHICLWPPHKLLSLAAGLWKERSKSKCSTKQEAEAAGAVKCLGVGQRHFCRILLVRAVTGTPDSRGQRKNTWRRRDCCGTFRKHNPYGKGIVKDGRAGKGGALCRDGLPDQPPWSTGLRGVRISGQECYRLRVASTKALRPGLWHGAWHGEEQLRCDGKAAVRPALTRLKQCLICRPQ